MKVVIFTQSGASLRAAVCESFAGTMLSPHYYFSCWMMSDGLLWGTSCNLDRHSLSRRFFGLDTAIITLFGISCAKVSL